jgi:hypothetical protein
LNEKKFTSFADVSNGNMMGKTSNNLFSHRNGKGKVPQNNKDTTPTNAMHTSTKEESNGI